MRYEFWRDFQTFTSLSIADSAGWLYGTDWPLYRYRVLTRCGEVLAEALSSKLQVLTAPSINYSCTTTFKSFEGCAGIKERTFTNMLTEICRDWIFQGFSRILLLSVSSENDTALNCVLKRLNHSNEKVKCFSLLSDTRVADLVSRNRVGKELGRSEYLILSLVRFLFPELLRDSHRSGAHRLPEPGEYRTWKKEERILNCSERCFRMDLLLRFRETEY